MVLAALAVVAAAAGADIWSGELGTQGLSAAVVDDFAQGLGDWQIAYTPEYYKGGYGAKGLRVERDPQRGPVMVAPVAFRNTSATEVVFITKTLAEHPRILDVAAVRLWLRLDFQRGHGLHSFIVRLRTSPRQFIDLRLFPGRPLPVGQWRQVTVPVDLSRGRNVWGFVLDTVKWLTLRLDDIDDEDTRFELKVGRIEFLLRGRPEPYQPHVTARPKHGRTRVLLARHSAAGFYYLRRRLAEALPGAEVDERTFRGLHFPLFWRPRPRQELLATDLFVFLDVDPFVLRDSEAAAIADAVASGAHIIVFGGPNTLNYSVRPDSPLWMVVPVSWSGRGSASVNRVPRPARGAEGHPLATRVPLQLTGPVRKVNDVRPRERAEVVLEAGGRPVVVTWRYKRGRATVVTAWLGQPDFFTGPGSAEWMRTLLRWASGRLPDAWISLRDAPAEVASGETFVVRADVEGDGAPGGAVRLTAAAVPEVVARRQAGRLWKKEELRQVGASAVRLQSADAANAWKVAAPAVTAAHVVICRLQAGRDELVVPVRVRPAVSLDLAIEPGYGKRAFAPGQPVVVEVHAAASDRGPERWGGAHFVAAVCPPRWPPRPLAEIARTAAGQTTLRFEMPPLSPGPWWLWVRMSRQGRTIAEATAPIYAVRALDMTDFFPIISYLGDGAGGHKMDFEMGQARVEDLLAHGFNTVAISGMPGPGQAVKLHEEAYAQARGMAVMYEYTNFALLRRAKPTKPCVLSPEYPAALRERLRPMIERSRRTPRLISVKITDEPVANADSLDYCQWCRKAFRERYGVELPGKGGGSERAFIQWALRDFIGDYVLQAYRMSRQVLYEAYGRSDWQRTARAAGKKTAMGKAGGALPAGRYVRRPWREPFDLLLTYMAAGLGFGGRTIEDAAKWSAVCDRIDFDVYPYFYPSSDKVRMLVAWPCFAYIRDVARHYGVPWGFYVEIDDRNWPFQRNPREASSECAWTALAQGAQYLNTFIYRSFGTGNNSRPERWEHLGRTLRLLREMGPMLAHTRLEPAPLAVLYPTAQYLARADWTLPRYTFAALRAAAGQCDVAVERLCVREGRIQARALAVLGVRVLHHEFAPLLVRWVRDGGVLFVDALPVQDERGQELTLAKRLGIERVPAAGELLRCGRGLVVGLAADTEERWRVLFEEAAAEERRRALSEVGDLLARAGIQPGARALAHADQIEAGLRVGNGAAVLVLVNHRAEPTEAAVAVPAMADWDAAWLAQTDARGRLVMRPLRISERGGEVTIRVRLAARHGAALVLSEQPRGKVGADVSPRRPRPGRRATLVVSREGRRLEPAFVEVVGPGGRPLAWAEHRIALRGRQTELDILVPLDARPGRHEVRVWLPLRGRTAGASFVVRERR